MTRFNSRSRTRCFEDTNSAIVKGIIKLEWVLDKDYGFDDTESRFQLWCSKAMVGELTVHYDPGRDGYHWGAYGDDLYTLSNPNVYEYDDVDAYVGKDCIELCAIKFFENCFDCEVEIDDEPLINILDSIPEGE